VPEKMSGRNAEAYGANKIVSKTRLARPIPTNYQIRHDLNLLFLAPFSWGHPKASGFCFQSERLLYGREPRAVKGGTGKAEAVKLPDAGISPKQWRKKRSGRKR
jgi:hypothetical protein